MKAGVASAMLVLFGLTGAKALVGCGARVRLRKPAPGGAGAPPEATMSLCREPADMRFVSIRAGCKSAARRRINATAVKLAQTA